MAALITHYTLGSPKEQSYSLMGLEARGPELVSLG